MDDNKALHLTSLDFDIAPIKASLERVQEYLKNAVQEIKTSPEFQIDLSFGDVSQVGNQLNASLQKTKEALNEVSQEAVKTNKTTESLGKDIDTLSVKIADLGKETKVSSSEFADLEKNLRMYADIATTTSKITFTRAGVFKEDEEGELKKIESTVKAIVDYTDNLGVSQREVYQTTEKINGELSGWVLTTEKVEQSTEKANKAMLEAEKSAEKAIKTQNALYDTQIAKVAKVQDKINELSYELKRIDIDDDSFKEVTAAMERLNVISKELSKENLFSEATTSEIQSIEKMALEYQNVINNVDRLSKETAEASKEEEKKSAILSRQNKLYEKQVTEITNLQDKAKKLATALESVKIDGASFDEVSNAMVQLDAISKNLSRENLFDLNTEKEVTNVKLILQNTKLLVDEETKRAAAASKLEVEQVKVKEQYEKQKAILTELLDKQIALQNTISSSAKLNQNVEWAETLNRNISETKATLDKMETQKVAEPIDVANVQKATTEFKNLDTEVKKVQDSSNSMLKTITDKARWLSAFYLIELVKDGFLGMISTIADTESAVVELQRVMNEDVGTLAIQDGLLDIAKDFGRTIEEVSETAIKFAQTGESWNNVLALTESTMLAVNTAELEVTTATTGLIAVMSQFNIEATDMTSVIDKINITADNFAVTSEKIVAALQRTGGSAASANFSLEETIAVITRLSEATGRTGETIGTALNSLIAYTSKTSALEVFGQYVPETIELYEKGAADILDIWMDLSKAISKMSAEQQQTFALSMANNSDYQAFADEIESMSSEFAESVNEIYGTAGTYRQNFLIALLNDMSTVEEALDKMTEAENYSLSENEKAMSTLTRQYETLKTSVRELAIEFGNAGFLNFMKLIVSLATSLVSLSSNLGGVSSAVAIFGAVWIEVKKNQIASFLDGIYKGFKPLMGRIRDTTKSLFDFKTGWEAAANGAEKFTFALNKLLLVVGLVITAYNLISSAIKKANEAQEASRQATISSTQAFADELDKLKELQAQYESIVDSTMTMTEKEKALADWKQVVASQYEVEIDLLNQVNGARQEGIDLIGSLAQAEYNYWKLDNEKNIKDAESTLNGYLTTLSNVHFVTKNTASDLSLSYEKMQTTIGEFENTIENFSGNVENKLSLFKGVTLAYFAFENKGQSVLEQMQMYEDVIAKVSALGDQATDEEKFIFRAAVEQLEQYTEKYQVHIDVLEAAIEVTKSYGEAIFENEIAAVQLAENTQAQAEAIEILANKLVELGVEQNISKEMAVEWAESFVIAAENIVGTTQSIEGLTVLIENLAEAYAETTDKINETSDAFATIFDVMTEYNETGKMSLSMMQSLTSMSGEYAAMLRFQGGELWFVDQTTGNLLSTKNDLLKMMAEEGAVTQIVQLAEHLYAEQLAETSGIQTTAAITSSKLASGIHEIVIQAANGEVQIGKLANALNAFIAGEGYNFNQKYQSLFNIGVDNILTNYREMLGEMSSISDGIDFWSGGSFSSHAASQLKANNDAAINALKQQQQVAEDALKSRIELEKERLEIAVSGLEEEKKLIQENADLEEEAYNKQIDAAKEYAETEKDRIKAQMEGIKDAYQAQIDALKAVEKENDRIRAKEDYEDSLRDANRALASAEARTGVPYREDEWNAREDISDIKKDWLQQQEDWAIEDEIARLETLRDAQLEILQASIDKLDAETDRIVEHYEALIEGLNEKTKAEIDDLNARIEAMEKASEEHIKAMEAATKSQTDALQAQITGLQQSVSNLTTENAKMIVDTQHKMLEAQTNTATIMFKDFQERLLSPLGEGWAGVFLNEKILEEAANMSDTLYKVYDQNFISKVNSGVNSMLNGVNGWTTPYIYQGTNSYTPSSSSSSSSGGTTTQNNNFYMDIQNSQDAYSASWDISDIFSNTLNMLR